MTELLILGGVLVLYMTLLFIVSCVLKNNGVADVGYGIGFLVLTVSAFFMRDEHSVFSYGLLILVSVWSLRLADRIYRKNRGKPEDFRYRAWREAWGKTFYVRSYFQVYLLQGAVIALVASPVVLSILVSVPDVGVLTVCGLLMSMMGITIEAQSDRQLDRFLGNPNRTGRIMKTGLWRYSRHPNYFGESLMWIGVGVATCTVVPYPLMSIVSPALITFLLLKVSGVPLLEKRWEGDPEWESYKRITSVFIPLPQRTE